MGGELMLREQPSELVDPQMLPQDGEMAPVEQQPVGPDQHDVVPVTDYAQPEAAEQTDTVAAAGQPASQNEGLSTEAGEQQDPEEDKTRARVAELSNIIDELSGDGATLSPAAREFVRKGGSIQDAMAEIMKLREDAPVAGRVEGPLTLDETLKEAREKYARTLVGAFALGGRKRRREAAEEYIKVFGARVEYRGSTPDKKQEGAEDADKTGEKDPKDAAAETLRRVSDTVLEERERLKAAVQDTRQGSKIRTFFAHKSVRTALIGAIVGTAAATQFHALPLGEDTLRSIDASLTALSSFLFEGSIQNRVYAGFNKMYDSYGHWRTERSIKRDETLADLVDRTKRAGEAQATESEPERVDPKARAAYVGSVYRKYREELTPSDGQETVDVATAQRYQVLVQTLVREEVTRQGRQLEYGSARSVVFRAAAVACAASFGGNIAPVHEIAALGSEVGEKLKPDERKE